MVNFDLLKKQKIWVMWKLEENNNKFSKIPYSYKNVKTGCSGKYKNEWCDYETAIEAKKQYNASGVSFIIQSGMYFIDIDKKALDDPMVKRVLELTNSYAEKSQSGSGIHIYGFFDIKKLPIIEKDDGCIKLDCKYYLKNHHNNIEFYPGGITNRFAVYTGDRINDLDICDGSDNLKVFLDEFMLKEKYEGKIEKIEATPDNVNKIINEIKKQKNKKKFNKLFVDGDISDYKNDQSVADLALCEIIAFRTGDNKELIDAIFKKSALYRDKWDREDYKEMTIKKALSELNGRFHKSIREFPPFVRFKEKTGEPYVEPVLLSEYIRKNEHFHMVKNSGFESTTIYVYENGVYTVYDDNMFKGLIKDIIKNFDPLLYKSRDVDETYKDLITDRNYVSEELVNNNEYIINFKDGLLHIVGNKEEGYHYELKEHDSNVFSTIQLNLNYKEVEKASETPIYDIYMNRLCENDKDRIELLNEFMGVTLSNICGYRMKAGLFMVSEEGSAGKSQYKLLIEYFLGIRNYAIIELNKLNERFGTASIVNKRLIGNADASYASVKELAVYKELTGGDQIRYEIKGKMASSTRYKGTILLLMNKLIKFSGDRGKHVYDRIITLPCCNEIPVSERKKDILEQMIKESNGIVKKALDSLLNVLNNNFQYIEPEACEMLKNQYIKENSQYIRFFEACMKESDGYSKDMSTIMVIYEILKAWCKKNNEYCGTLEEFKDEIKIYLKMKGKLKSGESLIEHTRYGSKIRGYELSENAKCEFSTDYSFSLSTMKRIDFDD